MKNNENRNRSIAKSITYRLICITMLSIVSYLVTQDVTQMTYIVVIFQSIQTVLYYLHERAWERITWGYA